MSALSFARSHQSPQCGSIVELSVEIGIRKAEAGILARHRADAASWRLATIPGIGPITASAIAATVPDAGQFGSGRQFAAWLGLTPKPRSRGGEERLGRISREGDGHIRRLPVTGTTAVLRHTRANRERREAYPGRRHRPSDLAWHEC